MFDVKLATDKLLEARKELDIEFNENVIQVVNTRGLISDALKALGYKDPKEHEDGEYVFYHNQYAKKVDATFDEDGQLLTLVDKDGNDWRMYAMSHGVFDPEKRFCYMKPVSEAIKEAKADG